MAKTTIPQIGKAVEEGNYEIVSEIVDKDLDLEQKIILGIQCSINGSVFQLVRGIIKAKYPLTFFNSVHLFWVFDGEEKFYHEDVPYNAEFEGGYSAKKIFSRVEQKNPEYMGTNGS